MSRLHCVIFLIVYNIFGIYARTSEILKVTLPHGGVLVGRHLTSHSGRGIRAFLGIPYAEPPLGNLRFKPPVPVSPWEGEKLVIRDSDICVQRDPFRRDYTIEGNEDCLYLNVYTPTKTEVKGPLSVMVWFHGGGWECGSGISMFYGPDFLLDNDIIYVSGNFRLGPLGFLSTGTKDCPGNNGLKDQVLILKWVQENIAAFGGDPNSVTIFGESAGGASGTYHMMSPMSQGLFHRAIIQSGTYLNPWAQPAHKGVAPSRAERLGKMLNCNSGQSDWKEMIECLQTKPAENITATFYDFFEWDTDPMIPFPPVVEPKIDGAFITEHPRDVKVPLSSSIPIITGITSDEGTLRSAALLNIPGLLEDFRERFKEILPITLNYDHHSAEIRNEITMKISEFYFEGKHDWTKENHHNLTNLFTDGFFLHGLDEYLRNRINAAANGKAGATYVYVFDHKGEASFTEIFKGGEHFYGVCHAEELQYLFPVGKGLFVTAVPSWRDHQIREAMVEMWIHFARTGNPTPPNSGFPEWKPVEKYPLRYAHIGSKDHDNWSVLQNREGFFEERANFWRGLGAHLPAKSSRDEL